MTYTELVEAARAYADRQDIEVDANIDIFFLMAESRINRVLKIAEQTHRLFTRSVGGQEYYSLPPDYNGMRSIQFNTGAVDTTDSVVKTCTYVTPAIIAEYQASGFDDGKIYYTIVGSQLQFQPTLPHGGTIEIVHYRKLIHLSKDNPTNWMSLDHPDIYLAGLLAEIESFVKNYDTAQMWDAKMTRMIEELRGDNEQSLWTGSPLVIKVG